MTTPPSLDGWASCFDFDFLDEDDEHELQNMGADRPTQREQEQLSCSNMYNNKPQEESEQIYVRGLGQVDYVPALEGEKALRLVTFNVARAFNKKRAEIKAFMEKHMVDIMLLQETGRYSPPRADSLVEFVAANQSEDKWGMVVWAAPRFKGKVDPIWCASNGRSVAIKVETKMFRTVVRAYALHLSGNHSFCFDTTKGLSSLGHASCAGTPAKLCSEDVTYIAHFIDSPTVQDPLPSIIYGLDTSSVESFWNVATQYCIKTTNYIHHDVNMMLAYLDWNWCVHQLLFLHQCTPLQQQKAKGQVSVQVQDPRVEEEENTYQQDSSGAKVLCFPVQVDGGYVPQVGGLVLGSSCGVGGR